MRMKKFQLIDWNAFKDCFQIKKILKKHLVSIGLFLLDHNFLINLMLLKQDHMRSLYLGGLTMVLLLHFYKLCHLNYLLNQHLHLVVKEIGALILKFIPSKETSWQQVEQKIWYLCILIFVCYQGRKRIIQRDLQNIGILVSHFILTKFFFNIWIFIAKFWTKYLFINVNRWG